MLGDNLSQAMLNLYDQYATYKIILIKRHFIESGFEIDFKMRAYFSKIVRYIQKFYFNFILNNW